MQHITLSNKENEKEIKMLYSNKVPEWIYLSHLVFEIGRTENIVVKYILKYPYKADEIELATKQELFVVSNYDNGRLHNFTFELKLPIELPPKCQSLTFISENASQQEYKFDLYYEHKFL